MCYGTRVVRAAKQLELYYKVDRIYGPMQPKDELVYNHANGWAHPNMWILPQQRVGKMIAAKWGIMPTTANGALYKDYFAQNRSAFGGLNLRSEAIFSHYMYSQNIFSKRCIIPVDGFFEPHTTLTKVKGKAFKVPFYFKRKDDKPMNLAGVYNLTKDKMVTFTIFTSKATPIFEEIHNQPSNKHGDFRRPVVLDDSEAAYWLEDDLEQEQLIDIMNNDVPDYEFDAWPISKDLHKRNGEGDRPDIIERVDYEEVAIKY